MHAVVITEPGGPDVLQWTEVEDPVPVSYTHLTLPTN